MELTFPTWQQNSSSMELTTLTTMSAHSNHNVCTLDGHSTFHDMGMIAAVTPETAQSPEQRQPLSTLLLLEECRYASTRKKVEECWL